MLGVKIAPNVARAAPLLAQSHDARPLVPKLLSRYSKVKRLSFAEHERRDAYQVS
jgi:hypothetical protein